jgi:protein-disulfide isomerase
MFQEGHTETTQYRLIPGHHEEPNLHITVFTSQQCLFCKSALQAAREAATRLSETGLSVEVVESPIEQHFEYFEERGILAVPVTVVGTDQIVGVPSAEDLENMVYRVMQSSASRNPALV